MWLTPFVYAIFPVVLAIRWKLKLLSIYMDSFIRSDWFDRVQKPPG